MPSKRKSATPSAPKKLSEETAAAKNVCNSIENQENRVNCANSKNYNSDSTSHLTETESKEVEHCQNGTNESRIIAVQLNDNALKPCKQSYLISIYIIPMFKLDSANEATATRTTNMKKKTGK